eukprot:m.89583 g.89583  ORF g.89583 m.89583 type:complete len:53 (+) comp14861_c0_seq8:2592-2750(+)
MLRFKSFVNGFDTLMVHICIAPAVRMESKPFPLRSHFQEGIVQGLIPGIATT